MVVIRCKSSLRIKLPEKFLFAIVTNVTFNLINIEPHKYWINIYIFWTFSKTFISKSYLIKNIFFFISTDYENAKNSLDKFSSSPQKKTHIYFIERMSCVRLFIYEINNLRRENYFINIHNRFFPLHLNSFKKYFLLSGARLFPFACFTNDILSLTNAYS